MTDTLLVELLRRQAKWLLRLRLSAGRSLVFNALSNSSANLPCKNDKVTKHPRSKSQVSSQEKIL